MKKVRSFLASFLAAVLMLGTAATAMAVADPSIPTTTIRFNLGGLSTYGASHAADGDTITLNGYRLLKVTSSADVEGTNSHTAYVYGLLDGENDQPHPLTTIMVDALNEVLGKSESDADAVEPETLIEHLATMTGDQPAQFAKKVWQGIQKYNEDDSHANKIGSDASFEVKTASPSISAQSTINQGYWLFVEERAEGETRPGDAFLPILLDTLGKDDVTVNLKKDVPEIDKEVKGENGEYGNSSTASIGDEVEFRATSKVPNMTGYDKYFFVVTDTLSKGLSIEEDTFVPTITIGTGENQISVVKCTHTGENTTHERCYDLVINKNDTSGETEIQIVFKNFIQYADNYTATGTPIIITYSATLTEDAVIGNNGNPNSVKLGYSNDPEAEQDGTPENPDIPEIPIGETPNSETKTYVTGIKLNKVDESSGKLPDAEFKLSGESVNKVLVTGTVFVEDETGTYYKLKDGTYTTILPDDENKDAYESTTTKYVRKENAVLSNENNDGEKLDITAITNKDGFIQFNGLGEGVFKIEETRPPAGYNNLKEPIYMKIAWDSATGGWSAVRCNVDGDPISGDDTVHVENGVITLTVENKSGTELPETGGIGTAIFYGVGILLILGAGTMLLGKKRNGTK